jgi:hypothetical protein
MGNHKQAIKDLREGIRRGLKNAEVIEKDESLQPLRSEPEFQKMLSGTNSKMAAELQRPPVALLGTPVACGAPRVSALAYRLYCLAPPSPLY